MEKSFWRQYRHWLVGLAGLAVLALGIAQSTAQVRFPTVTDMVAATIPAGTSGQQAIVAGRLTANDGGGGIFVYDSASAASTNLGTIFKPAASNGRWLRSYEEFLNVKWFGASGDGVSNDYASITNADLIAISSGMPVFFPAGTFKVDTSLDYAGAPWFGAGMENTVIDFRGSNYCLSAVGTSVDRKILNIEQMSFNGGSSAAGTRGILIGHNYRSENALNNVRINTFPSWGMFFVTNTWIMTFNGLGIYSCEGGAIGVTNGIGAVNAINFNNVTLEDNGTVGSGLGGGIHTPGDSGVINQWVFNGGTIEGNKGIAEVYFRESTGVQFSGTYFESTSDAVSGLNFVNSIANLTGCLIAADPGHSGVGVFVTNTSNVTISGSYLDSDWGGGSSQFSSDSFGAMSGSGNFTLSGSSVTNSLTSDNPVLLLKNQVQVIGAGAVFGKADWYSGDASSNSTGVLARVDAVANRTFDGDQSATGMDLRFLTAPLSSKNNPIERFRITFDGDSQFSGNLTGLTAGKGVRIKEGSNARMGTATLDGGSPGTVTVANTSVTANTRIFLTGNADGGTPGWVRVSARVAATSFTITSSANGDTSTVAWLLVEPSP